MILYMAQSLIKNYSFIEIPHPVLNIYVDCPIVSTLCSSKVKYSIVGTQGIFIKFEPFN